MSNKQYRAIEDRTKTRLTDWLHNHQDEMDALNYSLQRERFHEMRQQFRVEIAAEVERENEDEERQLIDAVWQSSLADNVRAYFKAYTEYDRLKAERDERIKAIEAEYQPKLTSPAKHIEDYNRERTQLLLDRVAAAGLEICFECGTARNDVKLVMLDGRCRSYVSDCMSRKDYIETYQHIKKLCSICRLHNSAPISPEDLKDSKESSYCFMRPAEVRPDGIFINYDGQWVPAPDTAEHHERDYFRRGYISAKLADTWNLPPELDTNWGGVRIRRTWDDDIPLPEPTIV